MFCIWVLPRDIPKDGDSKAHPLSPHHTVLEGGDDGWDEVLDTGEAGLAHTPWLIHQKHYVCLHHRPACWGKKTGWISVCTNTKKWGTGGACKKIQRRSVLMLKGKVCNEAAYLRFYSNTDHQIAVLFYDVVSFTFAYFCHAARAPHKSQWIFNETQVSQRDYQYSEHSSNKTLVQQWGTLRIIR